jgi:hypothetical protein
VSVTRSPNPHPAGAATSTGSAVIGVSGATVTGTAAALNATIDGVTDLTNYASVSVQLTGTWVGNISFQVSNDGVNWANKVLVQASSSNSANTGGNLVASGSIGARYFRLLMGSYTSGTATATIRYNAAADMPVGQGVGLNGGTSIIGGVYIGTAANPSAFSTTGAASTNATSVKTSAGTLFEVTASNVTGATVYLKLYNKASAPTVGTDVPIATIPVAASSFVSQPFGVNGKRFTTGIAWALTGAIAATDTTAVGAGVQIHGTYA